MRSPTSRLLALLELLQDRPRATGRELAVALGVEGRTLRRYVAALQELGIPIEGQRGVGGGYRILPGYRLPPLMLGDEEVVAVVLGLLAARASRLPASPDAVEGALAKIYRVLPDALRRRVTALEATVLFSGSGGAGPVPTDTVLIVAEAIWRRRRLLAQYTSHDQTVTARRLSPYGLVVHCGRWYLAAHDHDREALRTFRVDRMNDARVEPRLPTAEHPPDFDAVAYVLRSLASVPWAHRVSVKVELPPETARARLPATLGILTPADAGTHVEARVESLDWVARILAGLGCAFTIETPAELRTIVARMASTIQESARRTDAVSTRSP